MVYCRNDLCNSDNLHLAWKRILTSTRFQYKALCRESYDAFSWHVERKIDLYSAELREKIYQPLSSSKFYIPKKNGLVRPMTVLSVKDQLFYQAITNLLCEGKLQDIRKFRRGTVFGGFNVQSPKSIYFLSFWKTEYKAYKRAITNYFEQDYEWICKFDLASFYDTINHNILIEIICSEILDDDLQTIFLNALNAWSKPQSLKFPYSQGIPQGPCASQAIADLYLSYLDNKMKAISIQYGFKYLRYVDDIVLMGKSKKTVKSGLIKLDIIARELALVPQSAKIEVKKIKNIKEEIKGENSLIELISSIENSSITKKAVKNKTQVFLKKLFFDSIRVHESGEIDIVDDTSFKFSLYRLDPLEETLEIVFIVMKDYHHLVDLCILYLNKYGYRHDIDDYIFKLIESKPIHDWYTAQLLCYEHIDKSLYLSEVCTIGSNVIENDERHWFVKRKFVDIIEKHPDGEFVLVEKLRRSLEKVSLVESQLPYLLFLLSKTYKISPPRTYKVLGDIEDDTHKVLDVFYLLLGYMHRSKKSSSKIGSHNAWFTSSLLEYADYRDSSNRDGIYHYLRSFYHIPKEYEGIVSFKTFLGNEYEQALRHLYDAIGFFDQDPESYILKADIFNQVMLSRVFQDDGDKMKYDLDNMIGKLQKKVKGSCHGLQRCHDLRANSDKVHAYNKHERVENKKNRKWWFDEAKRLRNELSISYKYLVNYIHENQ